jgi:hypothetical protein
MSEQNINGIISLPLSTFDRTADGMMVEYNRTFNNRRLYDNDASLTPLYRGFGTHYAFIWVTFSFYFKSYSLAFIPICFSCLLACLIDCLLACYLKPKKRWDLHRKECQ